MCCWFSVDEIYCNVYDPLKLGCNLSYGQSSIASAFGISKEHLVEHCQ